jgi:FimV-like protein
VKTRQLKQDSVITRRSKLTKATLPALLAVSGGLATVQAGALELGELQIQSKLGQPLRASIAFALAPNEVIEASCVSVRASGSGLPAVTGATVSVANGVISLHGHSAIREPMLTANLVVNCPYTPHVSRDLMLFLDPMDVPAYATQAAAVVVPARPATTAPQARTGSPSRAAPAATTPVEQAARYRVVPGDSLSAIANRLRDREVGMQTAMTAIFEANPDAFLGNDPNRLQAGSWLDIPSFAGGGVTARTALTVQASPGEYSDTATPVVGTTIGATVYDGADETIQEPGNEATVTGISTVSVTAETAEAVSDAVTVPAGVDPADEPQSAYADLLPGDVIMDDSVVADGGADAAVSPDRTSAGPVAEPDRRVRGTQIIGAAGQTKSSWNWLIWVAAGGISLFGGYLMVGPRLRERFASKPVGGATSTRRQSVQGTPRVAPIVVPESEMGVEEIKPAYDNVDFDLSDDSPTEENLALDADLIEGTGLGQSTDVDVNQDFGFAVTTELDMELPELAGRDDSSPETDIIPPPERTGHDLVVDSEVLPDDSQYEMSVLLDVTKMPNPDDVTERDLKAVAIEDNGQTLIGDNYSINQEIDLEVLEKDYEDEFTATLALSKEIEKAAAELADTIDPVGEHTGDTSIEMQLTDISDLDVTATLEAQNDDIGEDDITARIEADDKTVEMPAKDRSKVS